MKKDMVKQFCFFNDEKTERFKPLTLTRPVDDLRVGFYTIKEKWERSLEGYNACRIVPDYLVSVYSKGIYKDNEPCLWVNSRYLPDQELLFAIEDLQINEKIINDNDVVVALLDENKSSECFQKGVYDFDNLTSRKQKIGVSVNYIWDLIKFNAEQIAADAKLSGMKNITTTGLGVEAVVNHKENIYIGDDVQIEPGCIFIAKDGPIVIENDAKIEAGSILRGPIAVGKNATIKMGARIYGGTTVGPVCKVGGEVSGSIFHSFSNKAHDGFCGNSIFGQWVNLGANTITSNLKNDYKNVKVIDWESQQPIETGRQFLGTIMADHSKTAINTMLNTGTICGVSSNVFIDYLTPKLIDSFTWLGPEGKKIYRFEKAAEVMASMMKRRNIDLNSGYLQMMKSVFAARKSW